MASINLTIPNEKLKRVTDAIKGLYPIPLKDDGNGNRIPEFSDNQWLKENIRRIIIRDVRRWETKQAQLMAKVNSDDSIIS